MKSVLITGSTGQTGSYLCDYILENHKDYQVHCTRRWRSREENIWTFRDKVKWHACELKDQFNVFNVIKEVMPERIFIFSASSFVRDSWLHPNEYMNENTSHLLNVMNAVLMLNNANLDKPEKLAYNPKIFVALSSEEYGKVEHGTVITEETPLLPLSPYGVSKVACDLLAYQYHQSYKMNVYRFRIFNNESVRRGQIFVSASFAKQVALIEDGEIDPVLCVGNTNSVRDWSDARDIARAIWAGLDHCEAGALYNISSGIPHTIDELIERLREISNREFKIKVDDSRMRPSDVDYLLGDCSKFKKVTGWQPEFDFIQDTVPEMLNYWRKRVKASKNLFLEELIQ